MFKKFIVLFGLILSLMNFQVFAAPSTLDDLKAMNTLIQSDLNKNKIATATAAFSTFTTVCSGVAGSLCLLNPAPLGLAMVAATGPGALTVKFGIALAEKKFILDKISEAIDFLEKASSYKEKIDKSEKFQLDAKFYRNLLAFSGLNRNATEENINSAILKIVLLDEAGMDDLVYNNIHLNEKSLSERILDETQSENNTDFKSGKIDIFKAMGDYLKAELPKN